MKTIKNTTIILIFLAIIFMASCDDPVIKEKPVETVNIEINDTILTHLDSAIIYKKSEEIDNLFNRLVKVTGFNGCVAYTEKGRVILKKAYGFEDVRYRKGELTTAHSFQLASVSKMFTAVAIMKLKNEGRVDYDVDIREYIPEFPYEDVTIRLMLTHRSGLPRYMSLAHEHWKNKKIPMNNDDMLDLFVKHHPDKYFTPDNGFHYCNTNYALLANIIEVVTGQYFEDYMRDAIFKPLKMDSTFIFSMRNDSVVSLYVEEGIPGFYHKGWRWREMTNEYLNGVMGDKGVYTSIDDLVKFDKSLDDNSLLPHSILSEAFKPGSPKYWKRKDNYGFGWRIKESLDSTAFHFGWWKGFRTFYIRDMRHQKTLIVLTNKDKGPGSSNFWNIIKADTLPLGRSFSLIDE